MLKRLLLGIVIGLVVGGGAAAAVIKGLGVVSFAASGGGSLLAYVAALATGAVVALVAGKPFWAKGAWIEVGLKAFFGSLLAAGGMFALRRWGMMAAPLPASLGLGVGALGLLPATSLPIIATALSVIFEVDNTDPPQEAAKPASKVQVRVASAPGSTAKRPIEVDAEDDAVASKKARG